MQKKQALDVLALRHERLRDKYSGEDKQQDLEGYKRQPALGGQRLQMSNTG